MNILFIEEDDNKTKLIKEKIKKMYTKYTGKIENKYIMNDSYKNIAINRIVIRVPEYSKDKLNNKFMRRLINILEQNGIKNIVLSESLYKKQNLINKLNSLNYNILDGRKLIKNSYMEILEYVMEQTQNNIKEQEISILVNDNSNINLEIINTIANLAKRVNIITNNISKFKKIENELYEQKGIMLSIGNNKKKGLNKSKYIVNIDFPEELFNKYKIYRKAVIINLENTIKIKTKSFLGIVINNIQIDYNQTEEEVEVFSKFDIKQVYESKLIAIDEMTDMNMIKKNDKFKIINTLGNNGIIDNNEYKLIKNLYKNT